MLGEALMLAIHDAFGVAERVQNARWLTGPVPRRASKYLDIGVVAVARFSDFVLQNSTRHVWKRIVLVMLAR